MQGSGFRVQGAGCRVQGAGVLLRDERRHVPRRVDAGAVSLAREEDAHRAAWRFGVQGLGSRG